MNQRHLQVSSFIKAYRIRNRNAKERCVEILNFQHFMRYITFTKNGDATARKPMRFGRVNHFYIRDTYMIPKEYVIEYVLGEHYAEYKYDLKVQVQIMALWGTQRWVPFCISKRKDWAILIRIR